MGASEMSENSPEVRCDLNELRRFLKLAFQSAGGGPTFSVLGGGGSREPIKVVFAIGTDALPPPAPLFKAVTLARAGRPTAPPRPLCAEEPGALAHDPGASRLGSPECPEKILARSLTVLLGRGSGGRSRPLAELSWPGGAAAARSLPCGLAASRCRIDETSLGSGSTKRCLRRRRGREGEQSTRVVVEAQAGEQEMARSMHDHEGGRFMQRRHVCFTYSFASRIPGQL